MKVKKFIAPSMPEAMKKIRKELGEHAVILNSKITYGGGFLGFFKKKQFEVIAAVDPELEMMERMEAEQPKMPLHVSERQKQADHGENQQLKQELEELKSMIALLTSKEDRSKYPEMIHSILSELEQKEIGSDHVRTIGDELYAFYIESKGEVSETEIRKRAIDYLKRKLQSVQTDNPLFAKKYINVVGPTGVGKTTTLAKLAAKAVLEHKKKIAFITTDTFRIAAIEQLKTYANLLNVPVEVVYNSADFEKATQKFLDYDLVLIDTAGRNYRENQYIDQLKEIIPVREEMETYLVLALTSKAEDLEEIIEKFQDLPFDQFIFTKLDETKRKGSLFNLVCKYRKKVGFLANGQNVPDDLLTGNPEIILKEILRE
ncbi:flagellar biosynthesis protein FlhF [Bacillus sp. FSL W8-0116]|uniref:flagellar biosynthesis protein FlhF n=1 Tax=Bacillus sp. FSL W8-0116 TaxID=2978206 RepID=UPI0030F8646A